MTKTPLDYQVPRPARPSPLWIIVRLVISVPLAWSGVLMVLPGLKVIANGLPPPREVVSFALGVIQIAFAVAAMTLPVHRRRA